MIKDLKDLKHLIKLCRLNGITEIKVGGVEFKMGEEPRAIPGDIEESDDSGFMDQLEAPLLAEDLVAFSNGAQ